MTKEKVRELIAKFETMINTADEKLADEFGNPDLLGILIQTGIVKL